MGYISQFLKPGGVLAVASPGAVVEWRELGGLPTHIRDLAGWEALSFHTPEWRLVGADRNHCVKRFGVERQGMLGRTP